MDCTHLHYSHFFDKILSFYALYIIYFGHYSLFLSDEMAYDTQLKEHARKLWEEGFRPEEVISTIRDYYSCTLGDKTLRRWAQTEDWEDWRQARKDRLGQHQDPSVVNGVSGIQDPILHLCSVFARRKVREHQNTHGTGESRVQITNNVLMDVATEYEPTPSIIEYLKPEIMTYISKLRESDQETGSLSLDPYISNT